MSTPTQIKKLEQRRAELVGELLATEAMMRGSFSTVSRKCGNPNCHCANGTGHPVDRITWSEDGRSRSRAIAAEDVHWAREMTALYKRFRQRHQALRALERQLHQAIDDYEAKAVKKTARRRGYDD